MVTYRKYRQHQLIALSSGYCLTYWPIIAHFMSIQSSAAGICTGPSYYCLSESRSRSRFVRLQWSLFQRTILRIHSLLFSLSLQNPFLYKELLYFGILTWCSRCLHEVNRICLRLINNLCLKICRLADWSKDDVIWHSSLFDSKRKYVWSGRRY